MKTLSANVLKSARMTCFTVLIFSSLVGFGTTNVKQPADSFESTDQMEQSFFEFEKLRSRDRGSRKIAEQPATIKDVSAQQSALRNRIWNKIKTKQDVKVLVDEAATASTDNYDHPDMVFLRSRLALLKPLQAIAYRLRPYVESKDTNTAHSLLVTAIRQLATMSRAFVPARQNRAIFSYLTEPVDGEESLITNDEQFRGFVRKLYEAVGSAKGRIDKIAFPNGFKLTKEQREANDFKTVQSVDVNFAVDTGLFYSDENEAPAIDRFVLVTNADIYSTSSALYSSLSTLRLFFAYQVVGLMRATQELGYLYGFDGFLNGVEGSMAAHRKEKLCKVALLGAHPSKYSQAKEVLGFADYCQKLKGVKPGKEPRFLEIMPGGESDLKFSFMWMQQAVRMASLAVNDLRKRKHEPNRQAAMDPAFYSLRSREIDFALEDIEKLVLDYPADEIKSQAISHIIPAKSINPGGEKMVFAGQGESITLNLKNFFTSPPKNLLDLMPTGFYTKWEYQGNSPVNGKEYRDYFEGSPKTWKLELWKKYLPSTATHQDIEKAARVLSQVWGGGLFSAGIVPFVL